MAKGVTTLQIVHPNEDFTLPPGTERGRALNALTDFISGILIGAKGGAGLVVSLGQGGAQASGTVTFSGATGTTSVTINGVAVSQTTGNDAARATAAAAAIAASSDPLVAGVVTASASLGVLTVRAVAYGAAGNSVTLAATGTGVTASGARLAGGTSTNLVPLKR